MTEILVTSMPLEIPIENHCEDGKRFFVISTFLKQDGFLIVYYVALKKVQRALS